MINKAVTFAALTIVLLLPLCFIGALYASQSVIVNGNQIVLAASLYGLGIFSP